MKKFITACFLVSLAMMSIPSRAQTISYATAADRRARAWEAFNAIQMFLNTQMSFEDGQWSQSDGNLLALSGRISKLESSGNFSDAFPCAILGLKVDSRVVTFTTPTPTCTAQAAWSAQTGLQATPRISFAGTVIGSYDPTRRNTFSFPLPATAPDHGTVQVFTYDSGGAKQPPRQIEF